MAANLRHLAAAWAIVLTLGGLALGVSALLPGVDTARAAAPAWRSVDQRPIGQGIDRVAIDWSEVDD